MMASALPSRSHRVTSATMSETGICTVARKALLSSAAAPRSGHRIRDMRSPGAMHFERLAAKYVRSGMIVASGTASGASAP